MCGVAACTVMPVCGRTYSYCTMFFGNCNSIVYFCCISSGGLLRNAGAGSMSDRLQRSSGSDSRASSSSKNVGPSLRACKMLCILRSLSRTNNVFLTKMDALLPETKLMYSRFAPIPNRDLLNPTWMLAYAKRAHNGKINLLRLHLADEYPCL